jgi:putative toxin-antitoxin system antitoxin component (TIGR02293 family)
MLTQEARAEIQRCVEQLLSTVPTAGPNESTEPQLGAIVQVTARAIEVLGTPEKALRWLKAPIRSLDDHTPLSFLSSPEGIARVEDVLGQIEHGVW